MTNCPSFSEATAQEEQERLRSQRGFTLVELMVALVISSIVVFFLFSTQSRMSRAFQGQGTVSEINQNLRAAKQELTREMRMAGYGLPSGVVQVASSVDVSGQIAGFSVNNDAYGDGADSFRILYTDSSEEYVVSAFGGTGIELVDGASSLASGQAVVMASDSNACLLRSTGNTVTGIQVAAGPTGSPFNESVGGNTNAHCTQVSNDIGSEVVTLRPVIIRSYRIDPLRLTEGYLQMHPSGEIDSSDSWIDLGVGFTNIQIATRYFETGDAVDSDTDGDAQRDWYSSDNQGTRDPSAVPLRARISLEARSPFGTRGGTASAATPEFDDSSNRENNSLGDWPRVQLAGVADASRPARYRGEYIYRYSTSLVDLRNMGVGNESDD